jgi:hypothetical protein
MPQRVAIAKQSFEVVRDQAELGHEEKVGGTLRVP